MFVEIFFLSSFTTSSGKFNKFDARDAILFQIQIFAKKIEKIMLPSYFTKVTRAVLRD